MDTSSPCRSVAAAASPARPRWAHGARDGLRRSAVFAAVGLGLSTALAVGGVGLPCPFLAATGLRCPLCGATTMGVHLLRGDLALAWGANAFVLLALCVLAVVNLVWVLELVLRRSLWPRGWPGPLDRWLLVGAVVGLAFAIARELG